MFGEKRSSTCPGYSDLITNKKDCSNAAKYVLMYNFEDESGSEHPFCYIVNESVHFDDEKNSFNDSQVLCLRAVGCNFHNIHKKFGSVRKHQRLLSCSTTFDVCKLKENK